VTDSEQTHRRTGAQDGKAPGSVSEPKTTEAIPPEPASLKRSAWEWAKSIAIALVIWFVLRTLLVEAFRIPSSSMERTLLVGDFLFVNKALYGAELPLIHVRTPAVREPRRGDVVVFDSRTEAGVKVVKRVVGMPGDTLGMRHDTLIRDGVPQVEPYAEHTDPASDPVSDEMRFWQVQYLVPGVDRASYKPSRDN